jgi:glutamyl-tRNA reductase
MASESVILTTCNRLEVYAITHTDNMPYVIDALARCTDVPQAELTPHVYRRTGDHVAAHLFGVAGGLDSMVIGESQILGQVRDAWEVARHAGYTGATLNTLFRLALEAGKDIRVQTPIARGATSVAHAAVELARLEVRPLREAHVIVLGAGEMGRLAALNLRDAGVGRVTIANRTLERAAALAQELDAASVPLDRLDGALAEADILIACAQAQTPLVTANTLTTVMGQRPQRPLLLLDIAIPRTIETATRAVPGVRLYDMDDLQQVCEQNRHTRRAAARMAEANIGPWVARFSQWQHERGAVEVIQRVRAEAETARALEVERTLNSLPDLTDRERAAVEAMSRALVNRLLHRPTIWLKDASDEQRRWLAEMYTGDSP